MQFKFAQPADVRTFREDSNYVVDVSPIDAKSPAAAASGPLAGARRAGDRAGEGAGRSRDAEAKSPPAAPDAAAQPAAAARQAAEPPSPSRSSRSRRPRRPARRSAIPTVRSIAELRRQGDNLRLFFPFAEPTPAAVFQRADTLWLVFDTTAAIDVGVLEQRSRARPSAAPP